MWIVPGALAAWFAHLGAFAVAAPLVGGHMYLALVHRSTRKGLRGVFDGRVSREWAEHHYPLWVADEDAATHPPPPRRLPDSPREEESAA